MVVNCETVWEQISNYIEGDVDSILRAAMDEHFRTCKQCTSVLHGTVNVVQLYGDDRMIEVPAGFGRRLKRRLARESRVSRSTWSAWSWWLIPVAALALIAGGLRWANSLMRAHPSHSEQVQARYNIPPDLPVLVAAGAKEFHVPECELIRNKDKIQKMTAKQAIREGYLPCGKCMRKYLQTASAFKDFQDSQADSRETSDEERARGQ
jgi:hypothetical protein